MSKGRYTSRRRRNTLKPLLIAMAVVLLIGCVAGGTLAWLKTETTPVVNTFTVGDINITLVETTKEYKMVPGNKIAKDPKATVVSGSENCYLFVKVEKENNFDTYMDMAIDSAWTALEGYNNVYYIVIDQESEKNQPYNVLGEGSKTYDNVTYTWADNQVLVKPTVTKAMMEAVGNNLPKLTFTAYAVQLDNVADAATAWTIANTPAA